MKVILTESIPSLGGIGDTVKVKPGYARNYLFPKKLAILATGSNVKELEHSKMMLARKREEVRKQHMSLAEKLSQVRVTMKRKVVEEDKLYGSVTVVDVHSAIEEQGFTIERKYIQMDQPVKQLGEFTIPIKVDVGITAKVTLVVEQEE